MRTAAAGVDRLYRATATPELVDVPELSFLAVDGHGDPNASPAYAAAIHALYAASYGVRAAVIADGGAKFRVSPLEGLWSADDLSSFTTGAKDQWDWTLLVRQPESLTPGRADELVEDALERKGLPAGVRPRFVRFEEGPSAQLLHVGPYAAEGPTIARLHDFLRDHGLIFDGHVRRHHEIYLGDPRRSAPERLRTIIRQSYDPPRAAVT